MRRERRPASPHGLLLFDKSCYLNGPHGRFDFVPERPQVTQDTKLKRQTFEASTKLDFVSEHCGNWLDSIAAGTPAAVNNDPELAAAAVMLVNLAVRSYREGKVLHVARDGNVSEGDSSWADNWEKMSKARSKPRHVPGWAAGDTGSVMQAPDYQKLAGPWIDGVAPESRS